MRLVTLHAWWIAHKEHPQEGSRGALENISVMAQVQAPRDGKGSPGSGTGLRALHQKKAQQNKNLWEMFDMS